MYILFTQNKLTTKILSLFVVLSMLAQPVIVLADELQQTESVLSPQELAEIVAEDSAHNEYMQSGEYKAEMAIDNKDIQETQYIEDPRDADDTAQDSQQNAQAKSMSLMSGGADPTNGLDFGAQTNPYQATIDGRFNPSGKYTSQTGAFIYQYAIDVPTGRANMTPNIALRYSSQNSNEHNIFGYGWEHTIPYIERINTKGIETLYTQNSSFNSSVSGKVERVDNTDYYFAKVDDGSFIKYKFDGTYWIAYYKDGTKYYYGQTGDSRVSKSSTDHYRWNLTKIIDSNGNFIEYVYDNKNTTQDQSYIRDIYYTKHANKNSIYNMHFTYESRNGIATSYNVGFRLQTLLRVGSIKVRYNNSTVKRYNFEYLESEDSKRDLLKSVQLTAGGVTLPKTEFTYNESNVGWTHTNSIPELPVIDDHDLFEDGYNKPVGAHKRDNYINVGDTDARAVFAGYTDWDVNSHGHFLDSNRFEYYYNSHNNNWIHDTDNRMDSITRSIFRYDKKLGDNDNDGHPDDYDINSGNDIPSEIEDLASDENSPGDHVFLANLNGDGISDITWEGDITYIGNGTNQAWQNMSNYWDFDGNGPYTAYKTIFADFNHDGLDDYVTNERLYINQGDGNFEMVWSFSNENHLDGTLQEENSERYLDVNSDGLIDILFSEGHGDETDVFLQDIEGNFSRRGVNDLMPVNFAYNKNGEARGDGVWLFDIDGDGHVDILKTEGRDNQDIWLNDTNDVPDRMKLIKESAGAEVRPSYVRTTESYDAAGNLHNPKLHMPIWIVDKVDARVHNGESWSTTDYTFANGFYDDTNGAVPEKWFAGFGVIIEEDEERGVVTTTYYHQDNGSNLDYKEPYDYHDELASKQYKKEYTKTDGTKLATEYIEWDIDDQKYDWTEFVYPEAKITAIYDKNGNNPRYTAYVYDIEDYSGNIVNIDDLSEVTFEEVYSGTVNPHYRYDFDNINNDEIYTEIQYAKNVDTHNENALLNTHLITKVSQTEQQDSEDIVHKFQRFYYDNQSLGALTNANLTKSSVWDSIADVYNNTDYTNNNFGQVLSVTNAQNNTSNFIYDVNNLFVQSESNALNHSISRNYDYKTGQVSRVTDANSVSTRNTFDNLGRVLDTYQTNPQGLEQFISYTIYDNSIYPARIYSTAQTANGQVQSMQIIDGYGNTTQSKTSTSNSGEYATIDYEYDKAGRLTRETLPYVTNSINPSSAQFSNPKNVYTYDELDRVLTITNQTGTIHKSYDGWNTTVKDANNHSTVYKKDAHGNLTEVIEPNNTHTYYDYDALNRLTKITDAENNVRSFTYDSRGNRLSLELPHKTSATPAKYTYQYNNLNQLTKETQPNGAETTYTYDALGRVHTRNAGIDTATYTYDSGAHAKGKLINIDTPTITKAYLYNAGGLKASEVVTYKAKDHAFTGSGGSYDYPLCPISTTTNTTITETCIIMANVQAGGDITINSGAVMVLEQNVRLGIDLNQYHIKGLANDSGIRGRAGSSIRTSVTPGTVPPPAGGGGITTLSASTESTSYTYDPYGLLTTLINPDNSQTAYTYTNTGKVKAVTHAGEQVVTNSVYNHLGQLINRTLANGITETYTYNPNKAYRLTSKKVQGGGVNYNNYSYTYDSVGNITNITDTGTVLQSQAGYQYDNINRLIDSHMVYTPAGYDTYTKDDVYTYSNTGNILTHNGNSYTYTNTQHPQAVTSYDGINYTYDTNGNLTSDSNGKTYEYDQLQRLTSISELALPQQSMMMKTQLAKPQSKIPNQFNLIWKEEGETGNSQKLQMEVGGEGDAEYNTLAYYEYNDARQRVAKITNGNTKKYISTNIEKFHNNTYQNHIFAGASRVATKQNNALTYNHPNHLSSNILQTDSSGAVQYSTFIRPFGVSVGHAGTRMHSYIYTDQELDYDTGLMYYDARYYNPSVGRFTSPDSVASFSPERVLQDPQSLNVYAYARNNPVKYVDPDGNEVQLWTRPVEFAENNFLSILNRGRFHDGFAHSFVAIKPVDSSSIGDVPGTDTSQQFVLAATDVNGQLVKALSGDLPYLNNCDGGTGCASVTVYPPNGVSQADFERNIVSSFNSMPAVLNETYFPLGRRSIFSTNANSNNAATTFLVNAGVSRSAISSYKKDLEMQNDRWTPGLGQTINGSTLSSTARARISTGLSEISAALSKLSGLLGNR